jgi:D-lactate dehydrogenase
MDFEQELRGLLPADRIKTRYIDRVTYGSDAGFYYLLPRAVVLPVTEAEITGLFELSRRLSIPLVFRAGGTSLSGQSITDGILVDLSRHWNRVEVAEAGRLVHFGPGVTGSMVNARLKAWHRKIGPDPSSIASAMMGGILSNNSSGMCCGVINNAYHTLKYVRFILPDGKVFDTSVAADYERFLKESAVIAGELVQLRAEVMGDETLREKIRRKYRTKNTVGYSLNAFIDYEHPLDIFAHLLIGAEGTLAFISRATLETIPQLPSKATGLLYFPDIHKACDSIPALTAAGAEAVELMDRASLRAVEDITGMPAILRQLPATAAALLVEFQGEDEAGLAQRLERFAEASTGFALLEPPQFTRDAAEQELLWKVRKGMFPSVGAVRKSGTTVILEDIAFPVDRLGLALTDLQALFVEFGYSDAIIFGHAKDGNIHFVVTQSFRDGGEVERYAKFIDKLVPLVVEKYDGALKAEHGTGRNMAPFVETEWGPAAYKLMQRLKACVDAPNLLNPGVILSPDAHIHLKDLKQLPTVETEVDKCIECGYCEVVCPSRDVTMTPRRRIVARRVLKLLDEKSDKTDYRRLLNEYQYDGLDTCAVDGLCAGACPVDINTGDLVKRLRRENHSAFANRVAVRVAKNFAWVERAARAALFAGAGFNRLFGRRALTNLTRFLRRGLKFVPLWPAWMGRPPRLPRTTGFAAGHMQRSERPGVDAPSGQPRVVYIPACVTRMIGVGPDKADSPIDALLSVARKVGIGVVMPEKLQGVCCGQLFSSKGYAAAFQYTANKLVAQLWELTEQGRIPVVTDVSSCTYTFLHCREQLDADNRSRYDAMTLMDSVDFLHDMVLPLATSVHPTEDVVLHPVCSLHKMGRQHKFVAVARHFAAKVTVPLEAGCCGMAGDRGFFFPELTAGATAKEAAEVQAGKYDGHYSSAATCELAMAEATGKNYASILRLVDKAMR